RRTVHRGRGARSAKGHRARRPRCRAGRRGAHRRQGSRAVPDPRTDHGSVRRPRAGAGRARAPPRGTRSSVVGTPLPPNRARFDLAEVASITGGTLTSSGRDVPPIVGVATDTRILTRGAAFVALRGARVDGHALLEAAAAAGASVAIVERDVEA